MPISDIFPPHRSFNVRKDKRPQGLSEPAWLNTVVLPIRIRILNFLRLWLDLRFTDFNYQLV